MNKATLAALLLALAVTVSACTGDGEVSGPSARDAFIGGTQGISIAFIENAPPAEVTDKPSGEDAFEFPVAAQIENKGEHAVPAGDMKVRLSGFFPGDFGIVDSSTLSKPYANEFPGMRKDPDGNRLQGAVDQVTFPDLAYSKELAGNQVFPFRAEACYAYATRALSQICILDNLVNPQGDTICSPSGSKQVSNSGAPVHVTSVTQSVGGTDKILLHFTVKKVGSGGIFKDNVSAEDEHCMSDFKYNNRVKVTVRTGIAGTECLGLLEPDPQNQASGYLRLTDGQASFTCTQPLPSDSESIKSIDIILEYRVKNTATTNVLVKSLLKD